MSINEARGMWLKNSLAGAERSESIEKEYCADLVRPNRMTAGKVVEIPYDSTK